MSKDMVTKYYDKRTTLKDRKYYNSPDELYIAKDRTELVGKSACTSWLGIKNISVDM